ncbi:hypothetical protein ABZ260_47245 [Streptosporangium sp. NPDC006013]|uniref:2-keto-4-pentenoate hydratase n=1 Tax=Streptosporangium sp. NPDC006013 TaxID=3155596 RepID=UPI0033B88531
MTANTWTVDRAVEALRAAESDRAARRPITEDWPGLGAAYQVQSELVAARVAEGERIIGVKLGLTSRAKQWRMGVAAPLTGWLTDGLLLDTGAPVPVERLIHPRVEPEIVFTLGRRLEDPGVTPASAMAAVRSVSAGLEVIDSRYRDFRFTLADVVADGRQSPRAHAAEPRRVRRRRIAIIHVTPGSSFAGPTVLGGRTGEAPTPHLEAFCHSVRSAAEF